MRKLWIGLFFLGVMASAVPWSARETASASLPAATVQQPAPQQTADPGDRAFEELRSYLER
ncbi:MAG: hypothetical protein HY319_26205 [Armatimonadetes bacterium]|nr:hypothetical protein [Armatimonadota bacterium]